MGVNVADLIRGQASVLQGQLHALGRARAGFGWCSDMVGVVSGGIPDHLRQYRSPAGLRMLHGFQDQCSSALAGDEAISIQVEGSGSPLWIVIALGDSIHHVEACHRDGDDPSLCAARDHRICIPAADHLCSLADCVGAGGAGGDDGHIRSAHAKADRHLPCRRVG